MKKKYSVSVLSAAVLLALTAAVGLSMTTYSQTAPSTHKEGSEVYKGQAGIEFTLPESSSPSESSSSSDPSTSSGPSVTTRSSGSTRSSSGSANRDGDRSGTVTIEDAQVPQGNVTILDPEVPLSGLPMLPQTGGNSVITMFALTLLIVGGALILYACKGVENRNRTALNT